MERRTRILCIDDPMESLRVRAALLEMFGCETILVPAGESALDILEGQKN